MNTLDCIVVGYNEMPFDKYEPLIRRYGEDSEVYRDLKFSFVDIGGKPTNYVDLMNLALRAASAGQERPVAPFRSGEIPNLAAVYLCNFLRRHRLGARYINLFQDEKDLFAQWLEQEPVCVAITTTFYILNFPVNEIVQFVRSCNPRIKIVVGGPLVSNHLRNLDGNVLEAALADMQADFYVLDSQGEMTLASLVAALKNGNDVGHVPNLAYFDGKQLVRTPLVPETNSMDESDIKWREFAVESHLGRTIQMRTARSCAFKCAFCNYPKRAGALSLASLDTIERELDSIRLIDDVSQVVFIDDTFNVPLPRFKDLCRLMIRKKFGFNWFSYFRCSNADEEAFDLMAQSGCKGVFLGIESGSPAILKNMNKAATIERYAEGIRSLRQRNILTFASFIVGFPGETGDTVNETTAFIRQQRPDFYRAQMWYCEPGTPILQERAKYDIRGDGFVWEHATMTSLEAMDCIEDMFLAVEESSWLPQWSFDFWFIPYIVGRGMSIAEFKTFVSAANQMLAMDIAPSSSIEKERDQKRCLARITSLMKSLNQKLVCADARSLR